MIRPSTLPGSLGENHPACALNPQWLKLKAPLSGRYLCTLAADCTLGIRTRSRWRCHAVGPTTLTLRMRDLRPVGLNARLPGLVDERTASSGILPAGSGPKGSVIREISGPLYSGGRLHSGNEKPGRDGRYFRAELDPMESADLITFRMRSLRPDRLNARLLDPVDRAGRIQVFSPAGWPPSSAWSSLLTW